MSERIIVGVALLLSALALTVGRGASKREVSMSFTATDVTGLGCEGEGCEIDGVKVRPFVSTERNLIFVSGVFESERVARWISTNPPATAVLSVHCEVESVGEQTLTIRFAQRDPFAPLRGKVYRAIDCTPY